MTVREAISEGADIISRRWEETPILDSSVILSSVLGISREKLLASYPDQITKEQYLMFIKGVEQRADGAPVAYITGKKEFYGLDFYVNSHVLTPRSDTEILVQTALEHKDKISIPDKNLKILDLCTGTGCIAISIKYNLPQAQVWASDISQDALEVFRKNEKAILGNVGIITEIQSNLLENIHEKFHIIISNPPYLTTETTAEMKKNNWPEPVLALDGGTDGLDFIRIIIKDSRKNLADGGFLMFEADPFQMKDIKTAMENNSFYDIVIIKDLAGRDRVIAGKLVYDKS